MSAIWPYVRTEALAAEHPNSLATGPFGSSIASKYFQEEGVPVIRGSNLSDLVGERLKETSFVFVSSERTQEKYRRSIARRGDLIFTCWGTVGQVGLIDDQASFAEYVVSNKQMKMTPDPNRADSKFLYYCFSGPEVSGKIKGQAIGSSVPGFNLGQLRAIEVPLPPLEIQREIADTLGSLDDKIDLNCRMNETLEEMARTVFNSWFVNFDPVRAKAKGEEPAFMHADTAELFPSTFVDSDLGPIPAGWSVAQFGSNAAQRRDSIRPESMDDKLAYIGLQDMPRRSIALSEWGHAGNVESAKSRFSQSDILFGKLRPYFHKVGAPAVDGVASTDIIVIKPKTPALRAFVLLWASSAEIVAHATAASNGTRMPRAKWKHLAEFKIPNPPGALIEKYAQHVDPMLSRINLNIHENRCLGRIRDLLLPKLLSGEIRVEAAAEKARSATNFPAVPVS